MEKLIHLSIRTIKFIALFILFGIICTFVSGDNSDAGYTFFVIILIPLLMARIVEDFLEKKSKKYKTHKVDVAKKIVELNNIWIEEENRKLKIDEIKEFAKNDTETIKLINLIEEADALKLQAIKHFAPLKRNIKQSFKKNDYGAVVQDNRILAINEFLLSINYTPKYIKSYEIAANEILRFVEIYDEILKIQSGFNPEEIPENGLDFEHWVSESLEKYGWNTTVTQGSGDQGLDVIAKKDNIKVGIQCKLYSQAVGNKAVQEIIAAKNYFDLDCAAVITNATYTKSAKQLAEIANVKLLSHFDIPDFDKIFLSATVNK